MNIAVELRDIRKRFGTLTALDGVSLSLTAGRVHGLLGENGAGKTTLMNILYGLLRADSGDILIDGNLKKIRSPQDALAAGVGMVHQHFMLAGAMTVLDNVLLGDHRAGQWLDRARAAVRLIEMSRSLGLRVDPTARIADLSVGGQQRVEILKALYREVRVLILDEPTAVLTPAETDQLFSAVDRLKAAGKSIVFISHKLGEIKRICDDLTVMRQGRVIFQGQATGVSAEEISRHMVGRDITPVQLNRSTLFSGSAGGTRFFPEAALPLNKDEDALRLDSISTLPLREVSLQVQPGEILGIAGVDGNGQQELAEAILGLRPVAAGKIFINGKDITPLPAANRIAIGVGHIPNDRRREGLVGGMSITENLALKPGFSRLGLMRWPTARRVAAKLIQQFDIRCPSPESPVATLSGGNQQKVILARELAIVEPSLVIAMNPVRGLDVAATQFVYEQLLACRARGGAVLLISSELDELLSLCDRIGVLYGGDLTMSHFPDDGVTELGRMMTGAA